MRPARAGMTAIAPRLAWNVALLGAGRALGLLASAVTLAGVARLMGPAEFGRYTFATVYIAFFGTVIDQGINTSVAGALSRGRADERRILGNAIGLKLAIGALALVLAVLLARLPVFSGSMRGLIVIASLLIPVTALAVVNVLFQVRLNTVPVVVGDLAARLGLLGLVYFAAGHHPSAGTVLAFQVVTAATGVGLVLAAAGLTTVTPRFELSVWRRLLAPALPLTASFTLGMLYFRFDAFMVSLLKGDAAMGIYGIAFRIVDLFLLLPGLIMPVVFPLLVAQWEADRDRLRQTAQRLLDVMALAAVPAAVFLTLQRSAVVRLAAGAAFEAAAGSLAFLSWGMAAIFVSSALGYLLIAAGHQAANLRISAAGAVVNVLLNVVLTPRLGPVGAALSALATQVVVLALAVEATRRLVHVSPWPRAWREVLLTTAALAVALIVVRLAGGGLLAAAGVAAGSVSAGVLASRSLRADLRAVLPGRLEVLVP